MSAPRVVTHGKCRVCGCTDAAPCVDAETMVCCTWVDQAHTLCDNVQCIARVPLAELDEMIADADFPNPRAAMRILDEFEGVRWRKTTTH